MNITKKNIATKIAQELNLSNEISSGFLNKFINIIKTQSSQKKIKVNKFGTFSYHKTKERIGRNPKNLKEYKIKSVQKLQFKPSKKVRAFLN